MKDKISTALLVIIIALSAIMGILHSSVQKDLKATQEILIISQNELQDTQNNLLRANNKLRAETEKVANVLKAMNETKAELAAANTMIDTLQDEKYNVEHTISNKEIDMIAKTVWGEARGLNAFEQSMVVWCILNRVDDGTWGKTIAKVITARSQFHGYSSSHPVTNEIKTLVQDVVTRWKIEKYCSGNVGRTLPRNYLYFHSKNGHNVFTTDHKRPYETYDWSNCWNPYS